MEIQNSFTKLRNLLNEREDELLLEVDNIFNKTYFDENLLKESEKLPNKVILSLEKGKELDKEWKERNLNLLINACINIENSIKNIEKINDKINESNKLCNMTKEFREK